MSFISITSGYLGKYKKQIILLLALIATIFIMYYTFNLISPKSITHKNIDYSLSNNHAMNIVSGTVEGFQGTPTTTPTRTLSASELALCPTQPSNLVSAVRSLYSGATFKIESISLSKPNEVFICGPGNFVIERSQGASNSMNLAIKDTSGFNNLQKFIKEELVNPTDANSKCIVFKAFDTALYVQYEHEHLSLRPLNTNSKPFLGQCFVSYTATPEEIDAHALAIGISKVGLDGSELIDSGISGSVNIPNVTGSGLTDSDMLNTVYNSHYNELLNIIMGKIDTIGLQLHNESVSSSVFGNKDAIKINVDLSKPGDKDGFSNISNRSNFQDMAANGSGTATVSQLLDQYLGKSGNLELGNIPALSGKLSNDGLLEIKKALQNKFKGCPALDRNLYYTERQLAQCSGCNPDAFLRGQLGGTPK